MNEQIREVITVLEQFDGQLRRVLNIGFRPNSNREVVAWCKKHRKKLVHLEAHAPNVKWIQTSDCGEVLQGDVRNIAQLCEPRSFDFILWLHGPEHIKWSEFMAVRDELEERSKHGVLYQAPIGERPQGNLYGNPYEIHQEVLYPLMFSRLHYCVKLHDNEHECCFSASKVW